MSVIAVASAIVSVWLSGSEIHRQWWWGLLQCCIRIEDWCLLGSDVLFCKSWYFEGSYYLRLECRAVRV